ncbi:MAG TPA: TadE/TadG family type IV pilus assembly protein [Xanthobacteraceae bacterium]|jgi:Flp pilus assembly protein TadG|nr:TadE/TadG family type IV pilus assembly protein [Xanthobacteraceae bacterium]
MITTMMKQLALRAALARLCAPIAKFRSNRRGNVAVITALCALPLVAAVGCVIDYTTASLVKTKLQAAADAAALATVSVNSSVVATAKTMSGNGTVSGGSTFATNFFNANLSSAPQNVGYTNLTPTATVSLTGTKVTAAVSFTARVPTYFMGVMGYSTVSVNGSSTASYALPTYINFYLMLDVSGSMSFPSTAAEQSRLMAVNPDNLRPGNQNPGYPQGCQFACHFSAQGACAQTSVAGPSQGPIPAAGTSTNPGSGGYCQGFIISRLGTTPTSFGTPSSTNNNVTNGNSVNWNGTQVTSCPTAGTTSCIQLRADAVGYAVTTLLSTAAAAEQVASQYQVGLFPFIQYLYGCTSVTPCSASSAYFPLTTNLTATGSGSISQAAANLASLLDTGANSNLGSGGTHFENALSSMNSAITSVGTGAGSSNALPYVFIITDGSQDYQTQWAGGWGSQNYSSTAAVPYSNSSAVIPPNSVTSTDYCTTIKNRGITIAILYIPYQPIQDPSTIWNDEDGYANNNIPHIPAALKTCASPNFFYTADTPADINSALLSMFQQAVNTAHITN